MTTTTLDVELERNFNYQCIIDIQTKIVIVINEPTSLQK